VNSATDLVLPFMTAIVSLGMFPEAPELIKNVFAKYGFLKWALLFALVYQGQGKGNLSLTALVVVIVFLVYKILDNPEAKATIKKYAML